MPKNDAVLMVPAASRTKLKYVAMAHGLTMRAAMEHAIDVWALAIRDGVPIPKAPKFPAPAVGPVVALAQAVEAVAREPLTQLAVESLRGLLMRHGPPVPPPQPEPAPPPAAPRVTAPCQYCGSARGNDCECWSSGW